MGTELAIVIGICVGMLAMAIIADRSHKKEIEEINAKMQVQDASWKHQVDSLINKVEELEHENEYLQSQLALNNTVKARMAE